MHGNQGDSVARKHVANCVFFTLTMLRDATFKQYLNFKQLRKFFIMQLTVNCTVKYGLSPHIRHLLTAGGHELPRLWITSSHSPPSSTLPLSHPSGPENASWFLSSVSHISPSSKELHVPWQRFASDVLWRLQVTESYVKAAQCKYVRAYQYNLLKDTKSLRRGNKAMWRCERGEVEEKN
jgi:hypothetical protein